MDGRYNRRSRGAFPQDGPSIAQLSAYISVGFVTFMFLIHSNKTLIAKQKQMTTSDKLQANYIYDPDHDINMSHVCPSGKQVHKTKYKDSPCVNKTFIGWYNPWARHHSWNKLWKEKDEKRRERQAREKEKAMEQEVKIRKTETRQEEMIGRANKLEETTKPLSTENEKPKTEEGKPFVRKKEKQIEMLYAILIALLLLSTMAACWEVVKARLKKDEAAELRAQEDRQCTLANFTINRHLRRESQQQNSSSLPRQGSLEKSKVTQTFIHQSSLDRAFPITSSEALNPRTERRYSVPAALLDDSIAGSKVTMVSPSLSRVQRLSSIDVTPEDISLDARKKPRHFIRRH